MVKKEIGGFFELELRNESEFHSGAYRYNSARSALYHLIKGTDIKKIFLPYYICNSVLEPLVDLGVELEFYQIDESFQPIFPINLVDGRDCILYINYFGVNGSTARKIGDSGYPIIFDYTQAFFDDPIEEKATIYSPRKFLGVPDGGYLYSNFNLPSVEEDKSYGRMDFLTKRIDCSAQESYDLFQLNEMRITQAGYLGMSRLTKRLLESIDYQNVKKTRFENFCYLHKELESVNELTFDVDELTAPMVYPLLIPKEGIREKLIDNKIFVATYWESILHSTKKDWFEHRLAQYMIPLPIDQRYGYEDMASIVEILRRVSGILR